MAVGDRVTAGQQLAEMCDNRALDVRAQIPARYLGQVRQALRAGHSLPAEVRIDDSAVALRLDRLSSQVGKGRGAIDALIEVSARGESLALGPSLELVLSLPPQPGAVAVLQRAVYGKDRLYKLMTIACGASPWRASAPAGTTPGGASSRQVRSEQLQDGDRIIVTQLPSAIDGLLVKTAEQAP